MRTLLVLVLVAAAVVAVVAYVRHRRAQQDRRPAPPADPFARAHGNEELLYGLKVSDVVTYHARDYLVRGSIRLEEDGYTWSEHLIADDRGQHWLSVEDDEGISVAVYDRVPPSDVAGEPGAPTVSHGDVVYRLEEEGEATYRAEGTTGTAPSGTVRYVDYRAADGQRLSFERFGTSWEASVGRTVLPRSLDVYPRSG